MQRNASDKLMALPSLTAHVEDASTLLDALANPSRIKILALLVEQEVTVGSLAEQVGLSQSALSQHLAKLRDRKLVSTRREAQTIFYRCQSPAVLKLLDQLLEIYEPELSEKRTACGN